jgi:hypothetical protein
MMRLALLACRTAAPLPCAKIAATLSASGWSFSTAVSDFTFTPKPEHAQPLTVLKHHFVELSANWIFTAADAVLCAVYSSICNVAGANWLSAMLVLAVLLQFCHGLYAQATPAVLSSYALAYTALYSGGVLGAVLTLALQTASSPTLLVGNHQLLLAFVLAAQLPLLYLFRGSTVPSAPGLRTACRVHALSVAFKAGRKGTVIIWACCSCAALAGAREPLVLYALVASALCWQGVVAVAVIRQRASKVLPSPTKVKTATSAVMPIVNASTMHDGVSHRSPMKRVPT